MNIFISPKIGLLLLICFLISCNSKDKSAEYLKQAQATVEQNPSAAIILLDSIYLPEEMNKDDYMQYIVTRIQAKYKNYQDITSDTLIFEALKYFEQKENPQQTALANYYTAAFYLENKMPAKAIESFLHSEYYAKKAGDNLLTGKISENIGYLHFQQNVLDSALIRYQSAFNYYAKEDSTDNFQLQAINMIGRIYSRKQESDSAYLYFNRGFEIAEKAKDQKYISYFTHNLGVTLLKMNKYEKAENYLQNALNKSVNIEDSLKIYLNLSLLFYNKTNQLELAKHYNDLMQSRLPEIKDNHILESLYGALADYNRQKGDYKEALHYRDLQADVNLEIAKQNKAEELFAAEKRYEFFLEKKEASNLRMRSYLYISISVFLAILIVSITYFRSRHARLKHNKEKELLEQKLENYEFVQNVYTDIINQWTKLERQAKALTIKYIKDEDPLIYGEMRAFMNYLSSMSNIKFIESSRDFLREQPNGDKAVEIMDETELLLLMLLYNKYNEEEISNILGQVLVNQKNIQDRKSDIIAKLEKAGMSNTFIEKIFPKR